MHFLFRTGTLLNWTNSLDIGGYVLDLRESSEEGADVLAFIVRLMSVTHILVLTVVNCRRLLTTPFGIIRESQTSGIRHIVHTKRPQRRL